MLKKIYIKHFNNVQFIHLPALTDGLSLHKRYIDLSQANSQ